ncbi:MAG: carbamoyltransferase HypF [Gammaproteobacteria bacterium]|nr:MAG: carbamoyltransferase HypF [Gammaproteobacteria bacterium]
MSDAHDPASLTRRIRLSGHVQGVGFRPFVFRLATRYGLTGWVQNQLGEVEILVHGPTTTLDDFQEALINCSPPLSRPLLASIAVTEEEAPAQFTIVESAAASEARIHVPPDYFTCDDCVAELNDPEDRRHRYPFINCTQCGPRYTLIRSMPYDRPNTSMDGFPLCPACLKEYRDPADRRFHAEPVACPECGPALYFTKAGKTIAGNEECLTACLVTLRDGGIVAVKGVGGYHLMCDASSDAAIGRLRTGKPRPDKPLAVMFPVGEPDPLESVRREVDPRNDEIDLLCSPARPIVLMQARTDGSLSELIAPGLSEFGVMLPYSPLHHLLLDAFGRPLVATSGNVSGEPVLTDSTDVESRIGGFVDAFLHHDRPIVRPADDSVYRHIAGRPRPIRLGRGTAPIEIDLGRTLPRPVLAVGGHMKNTIALGWDRRLVISPHIGDMDSARSLTIFETVVEDLQALYGVRVEAIVADAHPTYATTRWARNSDLPMTGIPHHFAHASAIARDWPDDESGIVFTWDGVGLGTDGTLWGGETLFGRPGAWRRAGRMRSFRLAGGERAGREPWRSAAALCWEVGIDWHPDIAVDWPLARAGWERNINTPTSTAVGRLFDAAASLTGLIQSASFEGQGPMYLETIASLPAEAVSLPLQKEGDEWVTDWAPLLPVLNDQSLPVEQRAGTFHASLARALAEQAESVSCETGTRRVALTGGVFQNRVLTELVLAELEAREFLVGFDNHLPVNDGGLCAGQVVEYAARHSSNPVEIAPPA